MRVTPALLSGTGGHALRSLPTQNLSPLVSPSEGELAAPLSASAAPPLDGLGPPSSSCTTPAAPPLPLKDNPGLAEFVPMLTQGWAEIFIRRPSGIPTAPQLPAGCEADITLLLATLSEYCSNQF